MPRPILKGRKEPEKVVDHCILIIVDWSKCTEIYNPSSSNFKFLAKHGSLWLHNRILRRCGR